MTSGPLTDDDVRRIEREIASEVRDDARSIGMADEASLTLADRLRSWNGHVVRVQCDDGETVVGVLESQESVDGHVVVRSGECASAYRAIRILVPLASLVQVTRDPLIPAPPSPVVRPDHPMLTRSLGSVLREHREAGGEIRVVMVTGDVLACAARDHLRVGVDHLEVGGRIVAFAGVRRWTLSE